MIMTLPAADLRKEVFSNISEVSVKYTHLPTGLTSVCSARKSSGHFPLALERVERTALRWLEEKVRSHETE